MKFKPQTGDRYHLPATGNTVRLGAPTEDGFEARYVDGPDKGSSVYLSAAFVERAGVLV